MKNKRLVDILYPYCDSIRLNRKHMVCKVKGTNRCIAVSSTPSDRNFERQIFREFRRIGVIIKELNYME